MSYWDGRTLKAFREAAGLSRRQLMFMIKEHQEKAPAERTIQRWEDGETSPDADALAALAVVLGRDVQDFFTKGAAA